MAIFKDRTGETYTTTEGYVVEVVEYRSSKDCDVKFLDVFGYVSKNRYLKDVKKGIVKNPYHRSVYGKGYLGESETIKNSKKGREYNIWKKALERCYSESYQNKKPTYIGCSVCEEWLNYNNFRKWYEENWKASMDTSWHLDKDILIKGNKIYSPDTCCFIPPDINSLLTKSDAKRGEHYIGVSAKGDKFLTQMSSKRGSVKTHIGLFDTPEEAFQAYKVAKENLIKDVADKWKGEITSQVYEALYNYKVDVTD